MYRLSAIGCLLLAAAAAPAAEMVVTASAAEVRSGPSDKYYATAILRKGERIEVVGERNGYLEIKPPAGSFSLIRKEHVDRKPGGIDVVNRDGAETLVGSVLVGSGEVRGLVLSRGTLVTILAETEGYYKILPANEVRYVAPDAVQPAASVDAAAGGPPTDPIVAVGGPPHRPDAAALVQQAEHAYQKQDWQRAQQLFETLARSDDHETRLFALNRLEFIGRLGGGKRQPTPPPPMHLFATLPLEPPSSPARLTGMPKHFSTYAYDLDRGADNPGRRDPAVHSPVPVQPAMPPDKRLPTDSPAPSRWTPGQPIKTPAPVDPPAAGQFREPGRLRRAFVTDAGRPLYYLEDSRGKMRCYFAAAEQLDPSPYLNRLVEVWGDDKSYRADLRGDYFIARRIELLGD